MVTQRNPVLRHGGGVHACRKAINTMRFANTRIRTIAFLSSGECSLSTHNERPGSDPTRVPLREIHCGQNTQNKVWNYRDPKSFRGGIQRGRNIEG